MSAPITLTGRLGADPELSFAASGVAICKLRVVTDRRVKDGDEWKDKDTTWWSVTCFKQLAENVAESLAKGCNVIVVGKVKSREWETKEGEKRTVWEVDAQHVGPDLDRATAKVAKLATRSNPAPFDRSGTSLPDDPWSSGPAQQTEVPF